MVKFNSRSPQLGNSSEDQVAAALRSPSDDMPEGSGTTHAQKDPRIKALAALLRITPTDTTQTSIPGQLNVASPRKGRTAGREPEHTHAITRLARVNAALNEGSYSQKFTRCVAPCEMSQRGSPSSREVGE